MINSTEIYTPTDDSDIFYGKLVSDIEIIMGIILIVTNTPIIVSILRHRVLRAKKEYIFIAGIACADMLAGWSMLIAGAYRMNLIELQQANKRMSWWHCFWTPQLILLTFSTTMQASMLLIISIDRFIAVRLPVKYVTFTRRYAIGMVSLCVFVTTVYTTFVMVYANFAHTDCIVLEANALFTCLFHVRLGFSTLSVIVYAVVWGLFRRYQNVTCKIFPTIETDLRNAQRRLTITVGICALLTFVIYVISTMLMITGLERVIWSPIYCGVNCINAVFNAFVYSLRHKDIRQGLKMLFLCKKLPSKIPESLHRKSSISVIAKEAMIMMEHMGVVVSQPLFQEMCTTNEANWTL